VLADVVRDRVEQVRLAEPVPLLDHERTSFSVLCILQCLIDKQLLRAHAHGQEVEPSPRAYAQLEVVQCLDARLAIAEE